MKNWQEDLLAITEEVQCERAVFKKIEVATSTLGFEHCAFGLRIPHPFSHPKTIVLNSNAASWWTRFVSEDCLRNNTPKAPARGTDSVLAWDDKFFSLAPRLQEQAQCGGPCVGWTQSSLVAMGVAGMLTLSRSRREVSAVELADQEIKLRWLVNVSHLTLARILASRLRDQIPLTDREIEVLRWSADGKTSGEVSCILAVSENTVNFHVKNAVAKLQTANKTAAVARAAMLGFLS
jgi:LuxR family transcriptional regulator